MDLAGYLISGSAAGAITGILGTGGGLILVPMLSFLCHIPSKELFATSLAIMLPVCITALTASPIFLPFATLLPYLLGSCIGAVFAGLLRNRISTAWLHRILALFILWGGIRFIWSP